MPHNDFLSLLLVNMTAGMALLAAFALWGLPTPSRSWAAPFAAVGLVALVGGGHLALNWPMPVDWANFAFGEPSVLLGAAFLAGALALAMGWGLLPVTMYGVLAGIAAVVIGAGIARQGLTMSPALTVIGYVLSGSAGILALPAWLLRRSLAARIAYAIVAAAAAGIWGLTGYGAYIMHLGKFTP